MQESIRGGWRCSPSGSAEFMFLVMWGRGRHSPSQFCCPVAWEDPCIPQASSSDLTWVMSGHFWRAMSPPVHQRCGISPKLVRSTGSLRLSGVFERLVRRGSWKERILPRFGEQQLEALRRAVIPGQASPGNPSTDAVNSPFCSVVQKFMGSLWYKLHVTSRHILHIIVLL